MNPPSTPVVRVCSTFNQSGILHAINHPAECYRLDIHHFCQSNLCAAAKAVKQPQYTPLGACDALVANTFIKSASHQAGGITNQESEILTHSMVYNSNAYYRQCSCVHRAAD